jgi:MoxR-like ATPase
MVALQISEIEAARERLAMVREEVSRVYIGETSAVDTMLVALLARGHALLEGVPGIAKTTLVKAFAAALGCSVRRVQFTPDLLPADITGTYVLNPKDGTFSLRPGPIFTNVLLADEINRAPAKTQSALLESMQEHQATIEGDRFALPEPFFVLATQNPVDLEGTYPLPEAQIDRFLVRVQMDYPNPRDEVSMLRAHGVATPEAASVLSAAEVLSLQSVAGRVHVEDDLMEYAVALARFTREHSRVMLGASPRASLGLMRAAKANALLEGRAFATPEDVRALAVPVLAHRLVLVPELDGEPRARTQLVEEALGRVGYRRSARTLHTGGGAPPRFPNSSRGVPRAASSRGVEVLAWSRGAPVCTGRDADGALEGLAERGFRVVANRFGHARDAGLPVTEQARCLLHSPAGDVMQRRLTHHAREPRSERRARHRDALGELLHRPIAFGVLVNERERRAHLRIAQRGEPARPFPTEGREVTAHDLDEDDVGEPTHDGLRARPIRSALSRQNRQRRFEPRHRARQLTAQHDDPREYR